LHPRSSIALDYWPERCWNTTNNKQFIVLKKYQNRFAVFPLLCRIVKPFESQSLLPLLCLLRRICRANNSHVCLMHVLHRNLIRILVLGTALPPKLPSADLLSALLSGALPNKLR